MVQVSYGLRVFCEKKGRKHFADTAGNASQENLFTLRSFRFSMSMHEARYPCAFSLRLRCSHPLHPKAQASYKAAELPRGFGHRTIMRQWDAVEHCVAGSQHETSAILAAKAYVPNTVTYRLLRA